MLPENNFSLTIFALFFLPFPSYLDGSEKSFSAEWSTLRYENIKSLSSTVILCALSPCCFLLLENIFGFISCHLQPEGGCCRSHELFVLVTPSKSQILQSNFCLGQWKFCLSKAAGFGHVYIARSGTV